MPASGNPSPSPNPLAAAPRNHLTERRLRVAGILVAAGLIVQLVSFAWIHPLAFMAFAAIGLPLVALGIILFLLAILRAAPPAP
jgi:apolipoprotein N-acyltransferase